MIKSFVDEISTPTVGEILLEEFMRPMGLSAYRLAKAIHVSPSRIQGIVRGRRKVTADTSLRLARFFGVSDRYFVSIQNDLDMRRLKNERPKDFSEIRPYTEAV